MYIYPLYQTTPVLTLSCLISIPYSTFLTYPVIVVGDFNGPNIDWDLYSSGTPFSGQLCDLAFKLNISQLVTESTHCKGNDILDIVHTNQEECLSLPIVNNSLFPASGHFTIPFSIKHEHRPSKVTSSTFMNFSKANYTSMCDFLLDWDFSPCLICRVHLILHYFVSSGHTIHIYQVFFTLTTLV